MKISVLGLRMVISRASPQTVEPQLPVELSEDDRRTIAAARPYTMTSDARLAALVKSVRYIVANRVPGAVVECGVWKGGSMVAAAKTLINAGDASRELYLYDTFEGMPPPTELDRSKDGESAASLLAADAADGNVRAIAPLDVVKAAMATSGYYHARIHYVKGKVEDSIPGTIPDRIALLRLDTDWYESTKHELEHLYPRLVPGGALIIDDYGHWQGARRAVDEYFAALRPAPLLSAVDQTGRVGVKPGLPGAGA